MKIGILTFQDTTNYGAMLQAYALNVFVNGLGYQCDTIQYNCKAITKREKVPSLHEVHGLIKKLVWFLSYNGRKSKEKYFYEFRKENIPLSSRKYDREDIVKANDEYTTFLVGSDIIWETNVTGADTTYFLDFAADGKKKYSYAASFGNDRVQPEMENEVKRCLNRFDWISVREERGVEIADTLLNRNRAELVCDPTLLLDKKDWEMLLDGHKNKYMNYVFVYFPDPDGVLLNAAKQYAEEHGRCVVLFSESVKPIQGVKCVKNVSIEEFLLLIRDSDYVFTASYHAVCFSLLFEKEFAFYNRAHASRLLSLANTLGFENRNLKLNPALKHCSNYNEMTPKLRDFSEKSKAKLANHIRG